MKRSAIALASALVLVAGAVVALVAMRGNDVEPVAAPAPVMSVATTHLRAERLAIRIPAAGHVAAWQEASIGAEANGLRLTEVNVNVGDMVRRGQVLARFDAGVVEADRAESAAAVAQAEALAVEADANARRARHLDASGVMSRQEVDRYEAAAKTARASLDAVRAAGARSRLRLAQTRVLAPDDGVISARTATVGAVVSAGEELFRMIKGGRLEWRAEVKIARRRSGPRTRVRAVLPRRQRPPCAGHRHGPVAGAARGRRAWRIPALWRGHRGARVRRRDSPARSRDGEPGTPRWS